MDIGLTGQHNMKPSRNILVVDLLQDSLYDESGVMCYEYGNMGEVVAETRVYALPFLTNVLVLKCSRKFIQHSLISSLSANNAFLYFETGQHYV